MNAVRCAVVGLKHGMEHVHLLPRIERAELVALCDLDKARLQDAAGTVEGRAPRLFERYDALLAWGELDAVLIATPPQTHKDLALAALRAGKHVLLEKPMVVTVEEAEALRQAHAGTNRVLQVGYCVRSSEVIRKCLEVIRGGRIGDVVLVWWHMFLKGGDSVCAWRRDRKLGGSKLIDCGCHYMDILALLAGSRFARLTAYGGPPGHVGPNPDQLPQVAAVIFEYQNGAKGSLCLSDVSPTPESSLFGVVGTNGIIYGNPWKPEKRGSLDCYTEGCLYREQIAVSGDRAGGGHLGSEHQLRAFVGAILDGTPVPCTLEDGCEVTRMTVAVDRSLSTGETVRREEVEAS